MFMPMKMFILMMMMIMMMMRMRMRMRMMMIMRIRMMMMMTTTLMTILPLTVKILAIEMRLKTGLNKGTLGTLRGTLMIMRHWTVVNLMQTLFLVSKTLQTQFLHTHHLPCHFPKILGKI